MGRIKLSGDSRIVGPEDPDEPGWWWIRLTDEYEPPQVPGADTVTVCKSKVHEDDLIQLGMWIRQHIGTTTE